jgi:hypothetical protein
MPSPGSVPAAIAGDCTGRISHLVKGNWASTRRARAGRASKRQSPAAGSAKRRRGALPP